MNQAKYNVVISPVANRECGSVKSTLVQHHKVRLEFEDLDYAPELEVKIRRTNSVKGRPYSFSISHFAHTPLQATPYVSSQTVERSERAALELAIEITRHFLLLAVGAGMSPEEAWLVPNPDF